MKPRTEEAEQIETNRSIAQAASESTTSQIKAAGTKLERTNSTATTGRNVVRKTAHTLIERRRRSKIKEESGMLKNITPACAGQQMHRLAILHVCGFLQALPRLRKNNAER